MEDRQKIMDYIAENNLEAALLLDQDFEDKADSLISNPKLYKLGRMKGTRELVVRPNYIMVYAIEGEVISILRVLHAAQQWP